MTMSGLLAVDMMEGGKIKLEEQMSASKTQSLARSRRHLSVFPGVSKRAGFWYVHVGDRLRI